MMSVPRTDVPTPGEVEPGCPGRAPASRGPRADSHWRPFAYVPWSGIARACPRPKRGAGRAARSPRRPCARPRPPARANRPRRPAASARSARGGVQSFAIDRARHHPQQCADAPAAAAGRDRGAHHCTPPSTGFTVPISRVMDGFASRMRSAQEASHRGSVSTIRPFQRMPIAASAGPV